MNTIGKILVVFVAASSLSFLAFSAALRNGGTDWKGEMQSPDLKREFVFTSEPGDQISYSVKHRRSESSVAEKSKILAEVILKARKRLEEDLNKKKQELDPQPQPLMDAIKATIESIAADKVGVEVRNKSFNDALEKVWEEIQGVGDQFSESTIQTQEVLRVAQERREEGYRLSNQLDLLRNDKFAANEQRRVLENELIRLEDQKRRYERRQVQLKQQLGEDYSGQLAK